MAATVHPANVRNVRLSSSHPRLAALLDLENLLHGADPSSPLALSSRLEEILRQIDSMGLPVWLASAVNRRLAAAIVGLPATRRIRLHVHRGGPQAADRLQLRLAEDLPRSADTIVIGSGDGVFAFVARRQRSVRRVVVLGVSGATHRMLHRAADQVILLPPAAADAVIVGAAHG